MADYRLPMDADGVKYHGTVDQNEENPGHFMYGLDENGNKRIIRTDEQGNVLTKVTGSIVELVEIRNVEIPANGTLELLTPNVERLFAKEIRGTLRFDVHADITVRMTFRGGKNSVLNVGNSIEKKIDNTLRNSFVLGDIFGKYYGIDLINRSDINLTLLYCQVIGVA